MSIENRTNFGEFDSCGNTAQNTSFSERETTLGLSQQLLAQPPNCSGSLSEQPSLRVLCLEAKAPNMEI